MLAMVPGAEATVVVAVDSDVACVVPSLNPDGPGAGDPETVVTAVAPIPESLALRVGAEETELLAVLGAAVVANPDNDPKVGVAEVLAAAGALKENPALAEAATVPPGLRVVPKVNPLVVVVATGAPNVGAVLGLLVDAVVVITPKDSPD